MYNLPRIAPIVDALTPLYPMLPRFAHICNYDKDYKPYTYDDQNQYSEAPTGDVNPYE